MNKETIKNAIKIAKELNGTIKIPYVPSSYLDLTDELYGLYYSGAHHITFGRNHFLLSDGTYTEITDINEEEIINKIYEVLVDNIQPYIMEALKSLEWEAEELKYFDDDPEKYETFKKKVLELKSNEDPKEKIEVWNNPNPTVKEYLRNYITLGVKFNDLYHTVDFKNWPSIPEEGYPDSLESLDTENFEWVSVTDEILW